MKDIEKVMNACMSYKDLNEEEKKMFLIGTGLLDHINAVILEVERAAEYQRLVERLEHIRRM